MELHPQPQEALLRDDLVASLYKMAASKSKTKGLKQCIQTLAASEFEPFAKRYTEHVAPEKPKALLLFLDQLAKHDELRTVSKLLSKFQSELEGVIPDEDDEDDDDDQRILSPEEKQDLRESLSNQLEILSDQEGHSISSVLVLVANKLVPGLELKVLSALDLRLKQSSALQKLFKLPRKPLSVPNFITKDFAFDFEAAHRDLADTLKMNKPFDGDRLAALLFEYIKQKKPFSKLVDKLESLVPIKPGMTPDYWFSLLLYWSDQSLREQLMVACSKFMPVTLRATLQLWNRDEFETQVAEEGILVIGASKSLLSVTWSSSPDIRDRAEFSRNLFGTTFGPVTHVNRGNFEIERIADREVIGHVHGPVSKDLLEKLAPMFDLVIVSSTRNDLIEVRDCMEKLKSQHEKMEYLIVIYESAIIPSDNKRTLVLLQPDEKNDKRLLSKELSEVERLIESYAKQSREQLVDVTKLEFQKLRFLELRYLDSEPPTSPSHYETVLEQSQKAVDIIEKAENPFPFQEWVRLGVMDMKLKLARLNPGPERDEVAARLEALMRQYPRDPPDIIEAVENIEQFQLQGFMIILGQYLQEKALPWTRKLEGAAETASIQHLFREFLHFSKHRKKWEKFRGLFEKWASLGLPLEAIDGDCLEFSEQFQFSLSRESPSELLVVSVVGPQSSGKSTLLNSMFGTQFLTAAGRCTKGAYSTIVPIRDASGQRKKIMLIDTEGIQSGEINHESLGENNFDRRLIFAIMCFSNLVIVCNEGEPKEQTSNLFQVIGQALANTEIKLQAQRKMVFLLNKMTDTSEKAQENQCAELMKKLDQHDFEDLRVSERIGLSNEDITLVPFAFNSEKVGIRKQYETLTTKDDFSEKLNSLRDKIKSLQFQPCQSFKDTANLLRETWSATRVQESLISFKSLKAMKQSRELHNFCRDLEKSLITEKENDFMRKFSLQYEELLAKKIPLREEFIEVMNSSISDEIKLNQEQAVAELDKFRTNQNIGGTIYDPILENFINSFKVVVSNFQRSFRQKAIAHYRLIFLMEGDLAFHSRLFTLLREESTFTAEEAEQEFDKEALSIRNALMKQIPAPQRLTDQIILHLRPQAKLSPLGSFRRTDKSQFTQLFETVKRGEWSEALALIKGQLTSEGLVKHEVERDSYALRRSQRSTYLKPSLRAVFVFRELFLRPEYVKVCLSRLLMKQDVLKIVADLKNPKKETKETLQSFNEELQSMFLKFLPDSQQIDEMEEEDLQRQIWDIQNYGAELVEDNDSLVLNRKLIYTNKPICIDHQYAHAQQFIEKFKSGSETTLDPDIKDMFSLEDDAQHRSLMIAEYFKQTKTEPLLPAERYVMSIADPDKQLDLEFQQLQLNQLNEHFDWDIFLNRFSHSFKAILLQGNCEYSFEEVIRKLAKGSEAEQEAIVSKIRFGFDKREVDDLCHLLLSLILELDKELRLLCAKISNHARGHLLALIESTIASIQTSQEVFESLSLIREYDRNLEREKNLFVARLTLDDKEADIQLAIKLAKQFTGQVLASALEEKKMKCRNPCFDPATFSKQQAWAQILDQLQHDQNLQKEFVKWIGDSNHPLVENWLDDQYSSSQAKKIMAEEVNSFRQLLKTKFQEVYQNLISFAAQFADYSQMNSGVLFRLEGVQECNSVFFKQAASRYFALAYSGQWGPERETFEINGGRASTFDARPLPAFEGFQFSTVSLEDSLISNPFLFATQVSETFKDLVNDILSQKNIDKKFSDSLFESDKNKIRETAVGCKARCKFCFAPCDKKHGQNEKHSSLNGHLFMGFAGGRNKVWRNFHSLNQTCEEIGEDFRMEFQGKHERFSVLLEEHQSDWEKPSNGSRIKPWLIKIWNRVGINVCRKYQYMQFAYALERQYTDRMRSTHFILLIDQSVYSQEFTIINEAYKEIRQTLIDNQTMKGDKTSRVSIINFDYQIYEEQNQIEKFPSELKEALRHCGRSYYWGKEIDPFQALEKAMQIMKSGYYDKVKITFLSNSVMKNHQDELRKKVTDYKVDLAFQTTTVQVEKTKEGWLRTSYQVQEEKNVKIKLEAKKEEHELRNISHSSGY